MFTTTVIYYWSHWTDADIPTIYFWSHWTGEEVKDWIFAPQNVPAKNFRHHFQLRSPAWHWVNIKQFPFKCLRIFYIVFHLLYFINMFFDIFKKTNSIFSLKLFIYLFIFHMLTLTQYFFFQKKLLYFFSFGIVLLFLFIYLFIKRVVIFYFYFLNFSFVEFY